MLFKKLNKVIEDQEKNLKKVSLKIDPKFDKLPYEGYVLQEIAPGASNTTATENPPSETMTTRVGAFAKKLGSAYDTLRAGAEGFKKFGQGDISQLKALGDIMLAYQLDIDTNKVNSFGAKGYTDVVITDDGLIKLLTEDIAGKTVDRIISEVLNEISQSPWDQTDPDLINKVEKILKDTNLPEGFSPRVIAAVIIKHPEKFYNLVQKRLKTLPENPEQVNEDLSPEEVDDFIRSGKLEELVNRLDPKTLRKIASQLADVKKAGRQLALRPDDRLAAPDKTSRLLTLPGETQMEPYYPRVDYPPRKRIKQVGPSITQPRLKGPDYIDVDAVTDPNLPPDERPLLPGPKTEPEKPTPGASDEPPFTSIEKSGLRFKIVKKDNPIQKGIPYVLVPADEDTKKILAAKNLKYAKFVLKVPADRTLFTNVGDLYFYDNSNNYDYQYTREDIRFTYKKPNYIMSDRINVSTTAKFTDPNIVMFGEKNYNIKIAGDIATITPKVPVNKLPVETKGYFTGPKSSAVGRTVRITKEWKKYTDEGLYPVYRDTIKPS